MATSPKELFDTVLKEKLLNKSDVVKELSAVYKFVITGDDGGVWRVICKENPSVEEGEGEADCVVTISGEHFVDMVEGKLNPQMAFMTQKLKIEGDMSLAMKLGSILQ